MKLLIDIDEKLYKSVVEHTKTGYIGSDVWLAVANGIPYNSTGDLISREDLKEHKFLSPQVKVIGGRRCGRTGERIIEAYQKGWNDCIDAIIDNATTVEPVCSNCAYFGEKAVTGHCIKCRNKDMWEAKNENN